jgi:hypothetical protein
MLQFPTHKTTTTTTNMQLASIARQTMPRVARLQLFQIDDDRAEVFLAKLFVLFQNASQRVCRVV